MKFKLYTLFIISIFLFSCNFEDIYNNSNTSLKDQIIDLNNQIIILNSEINRLDSLITNQLINLTPLDNDSELLSDQNSEIDSVLLEEKKIVLYIDPKALFQETYIIYNISARTCNLMNLTNNKTERISKEKIFSINKDGTVLEYSILEINKLEDYIKINSITYNEEFIIYKDND